MFLAGNIKSIGSFFATEHVNRVLSEASIVQLHNGGLHFLWGVNNSDEFVPGLAQKIVLFVKVRVFQENLQMSDRRAPVKSQFCLMRLWLGTTFLELYASSCCLLSSLSIAITNSHFGMQSGRDRIV